MYWCSNNNEQTWSKLGMGPQRSYACEWGPWNEWTSRSRRTSKETYVFQESAHAQNMEDTFQPHSRRAPKQADPRVSQPRSISTWYTRNMIMYKTDYRPYKYKKMARLCKTMCKTYYKEKRALVQFRTGPMTDGIKRCWCMHSTMVCTTMCFIPSGFGVDRGALSVASRGFLLHSDFFSVSPGSSV